VSEDLYFHHHQHQLDVVHDLQQQLEMNNTIKDQNQLYPAHFQP
jgi:hypothetical protein